MIGVGRAYVVEAVMIGAALIVIGVTIGIVIFSNPGSTT